MNVMRQGEVIVPKDGVAFQATSRIYIEPTVTDTKSGQVQTFLPQGDLAVEMVDESITSGKRVVVIKGITGGWHDLSVCGILATGTTIKGQITGFR